MRSGCPERLAPCQRGLRMMLAMFFSMILIKAPSASRALLQHSSEFAALCLALLEFQFLPIKIPPLRLLDTHTRMKASHKTGGEPLRFQTACCTYSHSSTCARVLQLISEQHPSAQPLFFTVRSTEHTDSTLALPCRGSHYASIP